MNWKKILLLFVLVDFAIITGLALQDVGYIGIFTTHLQNWGGVQVIVDLVIVCTLAIIWMLADASKRGLNAWPFVVITLFLGSFGPLLYLLRREFASSQQGVKTLA